MPKTVLLADDSVVIQKLVGLSFANENLRLITTDNGDDALARAREEKPDLVLADVVMPGTNGYEVCQAMKQDPQLAHIPVLLLTGTFEAFDEERAAQAGAAGHITKPFEAQGLVDRVQELLARSQQPAAAAAPPPNAPPQAARPQAEPTMVVQSEDDAYDFFDEEEADLSPEPTAGPAGADLGLDEGEDGFAFGGTPVPDLEPEAPAGAPTGRGRWQPPEPGTPEPGGDLTVAMVTDSPAQAASPARPQEPAATRVAFDDLGARGAAGPAQPPVTQATAPPAPPAQMPAAPPPAAHPDSFGSQNTAPLSPPPLPRDLPPTQILEGFSLEEPPPVSTPADRGETMLADDLFADASTAAQETAHPSPPIQTTEPATNEEMAFSFDATSSAAAPEAPRGNAAMPSPSPAQPAPSDSDPAWLQMDPLAAPFGSDSLDGGPPPDLLSTSFEGGDFAADADGSDDLLESFSPEDASDFDVSSSDLGDPLASGLQAAPPAPPVPSLTEAERPLPPQMNVRPVEPEVMAPPPAAAVQAPPTATLHENRARPVISPVMRDRIHETIEKVAWEAFADLSETIVKQVIQKVEEITWEVVPQMVESLIQEEIRRMKGEPE